MNVGLSALVVIPVSAWAAGHGLPWRPRWWAGTAGLALDLLLLDGLIYWWHRANHEVPLLWRFHRVHHLDRFLDASTAVRFHFGEVALSAAARAGVIVLLALVLAAAIFHHSNLRLPAPLERALALIVVTPSIHWVHHHRRRIDTDANYSTVLSLWDRLFRSSAPGRRTLDMAIGVEGDEELSLPRLIAAPFGRAVRSG
jgi:sterol desaturase/sphingolipid hydroxylase (fatty acid hydroxylase superfamily)